MKVKKWLIGLVAIVGLCESCDIPIYASSYMAYNFKHAKYHRSMKYITKPIKIERTNNSSVFAYIKPTGTRQLHIGERVGINQFIHMGKDGFVVYVPHHNRTIYYAPTNSHKWFGSKHRAIQSKKVHQRIMKKAKIKQIENKVQYYKNHINNFLGYEYKANNDNFDATDDFGNEKDLLNSYKKDLMNALNKYKELVPSQKHYYDSSINQVNQKYNNIIKNVNNDINRASAYNSYQDSINHEQNNISKLDDKLSDDENQYSASKEQFNNRYSNPTDESLGYHPWNDRGSIDNIEYTVDKNGLKKQEQVIANDKQEIVNEQNKIKNNDSQLNSFSN